MNTSMKYEVLIRRAHQVDRYGKPAADAAIFDTLAEDFFRLQSKPSDQKLQKNYSIRFDKMQTDLTTAFSKALSRVSGNTIAEQAINDCIDDCRNAKDYTDIVKVVEKGLDKFIAHGVDWK